MTVVQDRHPPSGGVTSPSPVAEAVERLTADTTLYDDPERLMSNEEPRHAHDILADLRTLLAAYAARGEETGRLKADVTELVQINTDQNSKLDLAVKALETADAGLDRACRHAMNIGIDSGTYWDTIVSARDAVRLTIRDIARSTLTEMRKT